MGGEGRGQAQPTWVLDDHVQLLPQPRGFSSDLDINRTCPIPPTAPGSATLEPCDIATRSSEHPYTWRHVLSPHKEPKGVPHLPLMKETPTEKLWKASKDRGISPVGNHKE